MMIVQKASCQPGIVGSGVVMLNKQVATVAMSSQQWKLRRTMDNMSLSVEVEQLQESYFYFNNIPFMKKTYNLAQNIYWDFL